MVTTSQLAEKCGFEVLNEGDDREVKSVFCGDLLSWAMGRAQEGDAWCTVMGNVNTIAVCTLADCACVVLCHGSAADESFLQKAKLQDVCVFTTPLSEFEACIALANTLGIR